MANYCTTTDVARFNQHRTYDTTNKPTLSQITSQISRITAEINARFSGVGITIPVTTSATHNAYLYVNHLATLAAACWTEKTVAGGGRRNSDSGYINDWCSEYQEKMKQIEENPNIMQSLIDGTQATFDSYAYSNSDVRRDAPDDEGDEEPFRRDAVLW